MGLLNKIITAVSDRAKDELKEYVKRVMEEKEMAKEESKPAPAPVKQEESPQREQQPIVEQKNPQKQEKKKQENAHDSIAKMEPLVSELPQKYTFTTSNAPLTRDITDLIQLLAFDEFAMYVKLYLYSVSQRKNYGYLGNSLRRKTGLDTMEHRAFELTLLKLSAHGLISIEDLSSNQRTFILYIPFDEEFMKKQKKKESAPPARSRQSTNNRERNNSNRNNNNNRNNNRQRPPREKEEPKKNSAPAPKAKTPKSEPHNPKTKQAIPGRANDAMSDEELGKQYVTFVSLEIDKAKMRVGRSSFDKIYMEAVKYIDSKYGFKVLSDTEKFKQYLTNYYMSAFDIPEFEEWKKTKK